jgi:hypothetical protein
MDRVTETDPGHNRLRTAERQLLSAHTSCIDFGLPLQNHCLDCLAFEANLLSDMIGEHPSEILTARLARVQNLRFTRILEERKGNQEAS